jgi:SHS2 domain-containing protein
MFEVFEHTADLGLRARAATLAELLAEAGRGLTSLIVANPETVCAVEERTIRLAGTAPDLLLFDWLTELIYLFDTERLLGREFDVIVDDAGATARIRGETANPARHELEHEVKAITYHELKVEQQGNEWLAEVIVDI